MSATIAPAGVYVLCPEGSAWIAVEIDRSGQCCRMAEEANAETHIRAQDQWAGICAAIRGGRTDVEVAAQDAEAVIEAVNAYGGMAMHAEMVVVERVLED